MTIKVSIRFIATVMLCPVDLTSTRNISLGIVQPRGPHDHPKERAKRQMRTITSMDKLLDRL